MGHPSGTGVIQQPSHQRARTWNLAVLTPQLVPPPKPTILEQVRQTLRTRNRGRNTDQAYTSWITRFIFFHNKRHQAEMGKCIRQIIKLCRSGFVAEVALDNA